MYDKSQINAITKVQAKFRKGRYTEKTALRKLWEINPELSLCQALYLLHN